MLGLSEILQGSGILAFLSIVALCVRVWILGLPERRRADNEAKVIEINAGERMRLEAIAAADRLKKEFDDLNKQNRKDIHDLKDQQAVTEAALYQANKALLEAASVQREDRADMDSMMFLIRILIGEVKRLDPDPNNKIIEQAEIVLAHMGRGRADLSKSDALNTAEHAVADAKQTVRSATATCDEVKASEAKS